MVRKLKESKQLNEWSQKANNIYQDVYNGISNYIIDNYGDSVYDYDRNRFKLASDTVSDKSIRTLLDELAMVITQELTDVWED